jgi:hypothetical protein
LCCNSLCRAPERWATRSVYFPARRVGAPVRIAAAAELRIEPKDPHFRDLHPARGVRNVILNAQVDLRFLCSCAVAISYQPGLPRGRLR